MILTQLLALGCAVAIANAGIMMDPLVGRDAPIEAVIIAALPEPGADVDPQVGRKDVIMRVDSALPVHLIDAQPEGIFSDTDPGVGRQEEAPSGVFGPAPQLLAPNQFLEPGLDIDPLVGRDSPIEAVIIEAPPEPGADVDPTVGRGPEPPSPKADVIADAFPEPGADVDPQVGRMEVTMTQESVLPARLIEPQPASLFLDTDPTLGRMPPGPVSPTAVMGPDIHPEASVLGDMVLSSEQAELNMKCVATCNLNTDIDIPCYIIDDKDCRNYIVCQRWYPKSPRIEIRFQATVSPCAFGTYWAGSQRQRLITCDRPENVICPSEPCRRTPGLLNYAHTDGSCRNYWACEQGLSVAKCCPFGTYFDERSAQCVNDIKLQCTVPCGSDMDVCMMDGAISAPYFDTNCKTFWDCANKHPHPVCCDAGYRYDDVRRECFQDATCMDACPKIFATDPCLQPGLERYPLVGDGSCRTYMQCDAVAGDDQQCCASTMRFDPASQRCVKQDNPNPDCFDTCPLGYTQVCSYKRNTTDPTSYIVMDNGIPMNMPCAGGTFFSTADCACSGIIQNADDFSCSIELDIVYDVVVSRRGAERHTEIFNTRGQRGDGPVLNGRTTLLFNGGLTYLTQYLQQPFKKLYATVSYLPNDDARAGRQILLSNCFSTQTNSATLQVYLEAGQIYIEAITSDNVTPQGAKAVIASVPYSAQTWNQARIMYDGATLRIINAGSAGEMGNVQSMTGTILVADEGMEIGGCSASPSSQNPTGVRNGFLGALAQIQFTKCLKNSWIDAFNQDIQRIQELSRRPPTAGNV